MNRTEKKNVVVIGGGTGTFTLLRGLKQYHRHIIIKVTKYMVDLLIKEHQKNNEKEIKYSNVTHQYIS